MKYKRNNNLEPEVLQCQQLCYLLKQLFIKGSKNFQILYENLNSLGPIMPVDITFLTYNNGNNSYIQNLKHQKNLFVANCSITYLSNASRYFCFLISKNIFIEYRLSSTLVKPERYFSTSSQFPLCTSSSKYFMLKKNPDSCSSLLIQKAN